MNPMIAESLRSVIGPATLGLVLLVALWRPIKRDASAPKGWLVGLSFAVALVASAVMTSGWGGFWPADTIKRLPHVVVLAFSAILLDERMRRSAAPGLGLVGPIAWGVVSIAGVWILTEHRRRGGVWEGGDIALWTLVWSGVAWLNTLTLRRYTAQERGAPGSLVVAVLTGLGSLLVVLGGSASLSQGLGVASAWAGPLVLLALLRPSLSLAGMGGLLGLWYTAIVLLTYTTAFEPPRTALGLTAVAPLALWLPVAARFAGRFELARRALPALIAIAVALGAAAATLSLGQSPDSGGDALEDLYG
ncbi:MAG: hypothetical protein AAGG07_06760 [Planctomycetota bacterium]